MIRQHAGEVEGFARDFGAVQYVSRRRCFAREIRRLRGGREIIKHHHMRHRRQRREDAGQIGGAIKILTAVAIAVGSEHQLRRNLREPVDHGLGAEFWRGRRPNGPHRRGGEHSNHGLGDVGHVGHHAVAGHDAHRPEPCREFAHRACHVRLASGGHGAQLGAVVQHHARRVASGLMA